MTIKTAASIILTTYGCLLLLWILTLPLARRRLAQMARVVHIREEAEPMSRPGSLLSGVGVLLVFILNIGTLFLVLGAAASPSVRRVLDPLRVDVPHWVSVIGSVLFVIYGIWGLLVVVYNPAYTPLFRRQGQQVFIATGGPYGIVRHPRYAGEALLNVVLFLFTGVWVPLLGILAWPAIRQQALAEEAFLMAIAPQQYGEYRSATGMFLPRPRHVER